MNKKCFGKKERLDDDLTYSMLHINFKYKRSWFS